MAFSNLETVTDRNGRVTEYKYDPLQRLVQENWLNGATIVRSFDWDYDLAGRLEETSDPSATYTFAYDDLDRVTSITHDLAALTPNVVMTQEFDLVGRRTSLSAQIGSSADFRNDYQYDALSRLTRITQQGQSGGNAVAEKRVDFSYLTTGQLGGMTRYSDTAGTSMVVKSSYGYDLAGRLSSLTHASSNATIADYDWTYDLAHRVTSFTNKIHPGENAVYDYDNTHQIVGVDRPSAGDESYTYDDNGNRINPGYDTGDDNQLLSNGEYNYTYDDEGNRLTKTEIATGLKEEYTWDYRNRLTKVTFKNSGGAVVKTVDYTYDTFNRWIGKVVDDDGPGPTAPQATNFVYDGNQIVLEFSGSAASNLDHRYLWGEMVDQILADEDVSSLASAGDVLWPLGDNLGTVRDLVDSAGVVQNHINYDSFGNILSETNPTVDHLFGYTGRALDKDTGLQNNLHRWYDSETGRWFSTDPIGFAAGDANLYRYVGNSPANYIDPTGFAKWLLPWEPGASWNPITTAELWFTHTPSEHLQGLYTGNTSVTQNTSAAMVAAGQSYTSNAGNAHNVLNTSGLGSGVSSVLSTIEGEELHNEAMELADPTLQTFCDTIGTAQQLYDARNLLRKPNTSLGAHAPKGTTHGHHSDPRFTGGDPKQPLTNMPQPQHQDLHKDLNDFLANQTDSIGNHMRPQRGNSGADIQQNFPRQDRLEAMAEFYRQNQSKYPDAARDFFQQHPHLK